jgi:two-component system, NtrC family, sensor kinase
MSLRSKIVIILSAVVLLYAAFDHLMQRTLVYDNFVALERAGAEKDLQRVVHALQGEIEHLDRDCAAWAASEGLYRFAADGDDEYARKSLVPQTFGSKAIHLLYVCDTKGKVVWGRIDDPDLGEDAHLEAFPEVALAATHPLLSAPSAPRPISGVFRTEHGPMLVSSQPIVGRQGGTARGTLIVGRMLDATLVRELAVRTEVSFELWDFAAPNLSEEARSVLDQLSASSRPVFREVDEDHLAAYVAYPDIRNLPALVVRGALGRGVTARGNSAVHYALFSTVAAGLLLMVVLLYLLQRTVIAPIARLTGHAVAIGRSEDFTRRIESDRDDEVGILAREFDGMIEKVAQSRADLVKAARAAGMSEIATGVLHNVGNVLNSVNVSATLVADRARGSSTADLRKVMDALRPEADDLAAFIARDPRGKHLYPLLDSLSEQLASDQETIQSEVRALCDGIQHIKELVQAQQSHAGRAGVRELVSLGEQIEAALAITGQAIEAGPEIEIHREIEELAPTAIDRHRVMEVLVNLIQNARQSVGESDVRPARIWLRLERVSDDRVRIEVRDNGVGIRAENLARVFTHGFTTKKAGHGFGLHASANAATEMGGKLTAHSDGPGRGATFVLELPLPAAAAVGALT